MNDDILDRFLQEIDRERAKSPAERRSSDMVLGDLDDALDRLPVIFAVDHSGSTAHTGDIKQINQFLQSFAQSVASPPDSGRQKVKSQLDIMVIAYADETKVMLDWTPGSKLSPSALRPLQGNGITNMGDALETCAKTMMRRLGEYRRSQYTCCCGYIFNLTDGAASDMAPAGSDHAMVERWSRVKTRLDMFERVSSQGSAYAHTYHFASRAADRDQLRQLAYSADRVVELDQADFDKLFDFVRISLLQAVDGEERQLPANAF